KVGRLHHWPYHGFKASAAPDSLTIEETRSRISFIFLKSAISDKAAICSLDSAELSALDSNCESILNRLVHLSLTRSTSTGIPDRIPQKLVLRFACHPGASVLTHSGSVGLLPRSSTDDGVRWKT